MTEQTEPQNAVPDSAGAARSAEYGIDYQTVLRTRSRVRKGAVVIVGIAMALLLGMSLTATSLATESLNIGLYLTAGAVVVGAQLLAYIATILIGVVAFARKDVLAQERAVAIVYVASTAAALGLAVAFLPDEPSARFGALVGSLFGGMVSLSGVLSLPEMLKSERPQMPAAIVRYQQLPQWQTLLGGKTRFILIEMSLKMVTDFGIVLVAFGNAVALVPLAFIGIATTLVGSRFIAQDRPRETVATSAVYAAAALTAAVLVS